MLSESEAKRIAQRALHLSAAEATEVLVHTEDSSLTRFANNQIHQNVAERDASITVKASIGKKYGVASTNDLTDEGLERAIDQATGMARLLPELDGFLPPAAPAETASATSYSITTAEFGPLQRASGVRVICERAKEHRLTAAGAFKVEIDGITVANSEGLLAQHSSTMSELMAVAMSDDSSGHSGQLASDVSEINPEAVAAEAVGKAVAGRNPRAIGAGEYEVVLEEYAVSDMLDFMSYLAFGAQAVQEGRSFMTGKLGQKLMGDNISIWDDGLDPSGIGQPFDFEGVPARRVDLISGGVAGGPCYDRRTASKDGTESTGHSLPPGSTIGPLPRHMFLGPGSSAREDLIRSVKHGLLITRFWYTRVVHPLTVTMTGMTRDGTFLIENGEMAGPVRNLRFTQSYLEAMNRADLIGRDTKLVSEFFSVNRVPALKVAGWNFTGATEY